MKNYFCHAFIISCVLNLTGCYFMEQRQNEYLQAQNSTPIKVPAGISTTNIHEDYPVPGANAVSPKKPVNLLPPDSMAEQIKTGKISVAALKQEEPETITENLSLPHVHNGSAFKNDTLILDKPADDSWQSVGESLNKAGYRIVHKNPDTLIYYVLDIYATNGKIIRATPIYQIHLRNIPLGTEVYVTDNTGKRVSLSEANRILDSIYNALPNKPTKKANTGIDQAPFATQSQVPTSNFGQLMHTLFNY